MIGDLLLRGVSVGTVTHETETTYTVYTQYGQEETWPKSGAQQIVSYKTVLSVFERSILDATRNNSDSK